MPNPHSLLMLNSDQISRLLSDDEVIATQREAFVSLSDGTGQLGPRVLLPGSDNAVVFSYAARLGQDTPPVCKFGSVVPANSARGLPTVGAIVVALDAVTGKPAAVLDGEAVTNLRTVAASVVAAQALTDSPRRVAILGFGQQGRLHAAAFKKHLQPQEVVVWEPSDVDIDEERAESPLAAIEDADLVVCCTATREPLFPSGAVRPGATVISIGSFAPDRREVGVDLVSSSRLVVDHVATAINQAGPIVHGLAVGAIEADNLVSIGDVLSGVSPARLDPNDTVLYTSVGVGIQDAAVVHELLKRASADGHGQHVPW